MGWLSVRAQSYQYALEEKESRQQSATYKYDASKNFNLAPLTTIYEYDLCIHISASYKYDASEN